MSAEGEQLLDKLMEVVSGQPVGAINEALVNLTAAVITSNADTMTEVEQALRDYGIVLDNVVREHWKAARRDVVGKG